MKHEPVVRSRSKVLEILLLTAAVALATVVVMLLAPYIGFVN